MGCAVDRVYVDSGTEEARRLRALGFPAYDGASRSQATHAFLVGEQEGALDLRPPGEHGRPGIRAIFPPDRGGDSRNPLLRAFGKRIVAVHDLTAGLGGDAYRLARAGYCVRACERDPVVFAVLASGWSKARRDGRIPTEIASRLTFACRDAAEALLSIEGLDQGVYVDPMYPAPRRASAKPRRELQVLRALLGAQEDAAALVEAARSRVARVVVKRPHHADPLVAGRNHEIETKLVRFDVYTNPARMSARTADLGAAG